VGYSDSDWAGDKVDQESTFGACQFIGQLLVSWSSKKQNSISLSTAEAEYISAASCCTQLLWMKQTLKYYGVSLGMVLLLWDNESAIKIANNPSNTPAPNISTFATTSYVTMSQGVILLSLMSAPITNWRIFSRNLGMKPGLLS
jgi:hypothetical protein